jgi:hypothetical protein
MRWNLHDVIIEGMANDATLRQEWQRSFASLPGATAVPDIQIILNLVPSLPPTPPGEPQFRQGDLLAYYVQGQDVIVHFPRFGQLQLDLSGGATNGRLLTTALTTYGVLEDLIAIGLSPHLRRRGLFLIHAFAAAYEGKAVLLVGDIGTGKTTTGLSLLNVGWQLLSNDSPIISQSGEVLSYPGILAGYPDTFAHFPVTAELAQQQPEQAGRQKLTIPAEQIWPEVWCAQAAIGAILFPQIKGEGAHESRPLAPIEALQQLLPHAVEQWDKVMMPQHLAVLRQLVEMAPAYQLLLGPDVLTIPATIESLFHLKFGQQGKVIGGLVDGFDLINHPAGP